MNVSPLKPHVAASDIAPERLANNPQLTEREKIAEASRQFESILLKQILDGSQKTVIKSKYTDESTASGIYHDMITTQLADSISKSGAFGLAKTFEQQLNRPETKAGETSAAQSLRPLHEKDQKAPVSHQPVAINKKPASGTLALPGITAIPDTKARFRNH